MKKTMYIAMALCLLSIALLTTNCTNEETIFVDTERTALVVKTNVTGQTRADIKEAFVKGDQMALFATKDQENTIYNTALSKGSNICATYSRDEKWEVDFYLDSEKLNIYAYYPYGDYYLGDHNPAIITTLFGRTDVLFGTHATGTNSTVSKDEPEVLLQMRHALAAIDFYFKKQDYSETGKITEIEVRNRPGLDKKVIPLEVTIELVTGKITGAGDGEYSILHKNETAGLVSDLTNTYPAEGYVMFAYTNFPSVKEGDIQILFTIDGKKYTWDLPQGTQWDSGCKYHYYICLSAGKLQLETVIIEPYEDGGSDSTILS